MIFRWEKGGYRIDIDDDTGGQSFFIGNEPAKDAADLLSIFRALLYDCYYNGSLFNPVAVRADVDQHDQLVTIHPSRNNNHD